MVNSNAPGISVPADAQPVSQQDGVLIPAEFTADVDQLTDVEEDVLQYVAGASLRASSSCADCSQLVRLGKGEKVGVFL